MSSKENQSLNQLGNMEQIREILFGSQIRMFEEEMGKLDSSINAMHSEINKRIENLEKILRKEHDLAVQTSEQKIKNLTTAMQDESSDFKEQLVKNEKKFNHTIGITKEEIEAQLNTLKNDQNSAKETTKNDLETLQSSINEILNQQIENLSGNKVSKDDFSEMLLDMAMKIKGTNIENSLEKILQEKKPSK